MLKSRYRDGQSITEAIDAADLVEDAYKGVGFVSGRIVSQTIHSKAANEPKKLGIKKCFVR